MWQKAYDCGTGLRLCACNFGHCIPSPSLKWLTLFRTQITRTPTKVQTDMVLLWKQNRSLNQWCHYKPEPGLRAVMRNNIVCDNTLIQWDTLWCSAKYNRPYASNAYLLIYFYFTLYRPFRSNILLACALFHSRWYHHWGWNAMCVLVECTKRE